LAENSFVPNHKLVFVLNYFSDLKSVKDLQLIPTNNSTKSRSACTKIQQMYENVQPNLALVLLFERTEVECGKGLFFACIKRLGIFLLQFLNLKI